jgi:HAMP domain-containing protein
MPGSVKAGSPVIMRVPIAHRLRFARSAAIEFGSLHETLLISSIATILVIRTQLWLTNYPQLGGSGLHIAHLLWGGLFMLFAIGLLLTFLGRQVRRAAAIIGGVGFGFFVDELGKFVTEDNNYFYRPAASLIYLIFVGLFLLSRALQRGGRLSAPNEVANAVDLLGEAARHDLDEAERRQGLALLARADPADSLVAPLRSLFERLPVVPVAAPGAAGQAAAAARRLAGRFAAWTGFASFVSWLFGVWALLSVIGVFELVFSVVVEFGGAHPGYASDRVGDLEFVNVASLASTFVSAALVARGALQLRKGNRSAAYTSFDRALLVAIFVTQVFAFFESQFGAVFGLAIDLLLLVALRSLRAAEQHDDAEALPAQPPPAPPLTTPLLDAQ